MGRYPRLLWVLKQDCSRKDLVRRRCRGDETTPSMLTTRGPSRMTVHGGWDRSPRVTRGTGDPSSTKSRGPSVVVEGSPRTVVTDVETRRGSRLFPFHSSDRSVPSFRPPSQVSGRGWGRPHTPRSLRTCKVPPSSLSTTGLPFEFESHLISERVLDVSTT